MGAPDVVGAGAEPEPPAADGETPALCDPGADAGRLCGEKCLRLGVSWNQGIYWMLADTISDVLYLKYYFWGLLALFCDRALWISFPAEAYEGRVYRVDRRPWRRSEAFGFCQGCFRACWIKIAPNVPIFCAPASVGYIQFVHFCGSRPAGRSGGGRSCFTGGERMDTRGLLLLFFWKIFLVLLSGRNFWSESTYIPVLLLLLACLGISLYLSARGEFRIPKGRGMALSGIKLLRPAGALGGAQVGQSEGESGAVRESGRPRFRHNRLDDSYNNVLIRELLGRRLCLWENRPYRRGAGAVRHSPVVL